MNDLFNLARSAAQFPDNVAVWTDSTTALSYNDVWCSSEIIAQWLQHHGVTARTPWVALEARKDLSSVLTVWTLVSLGIPFVLLHPAWSDVQRAAVLAQTAAVEIPLPPLPSQQPRAATHTSYKQLERVVEGDAELCVVYTSGTTGVPKGVVLSRRAFAVSAREAEQWLQLQPNDRWFLSLPLAHVGGLSVLTRTWLTHSSVVLPPTETAFDAARFLEHCRSSQATLVSLVPTQMQRITAAALHAPPALRCVLLGGAPSPTSLVARAKTLGFVVVRTYGLTELCSLVATERLEQQGSAAAATPGFLPVHSHVSAQLNHEGRLMLQSQAMYSGYWGQTPRTEAEWFTTEDLAEVSGDGVRILGRADDVIVTGGEKVHPAQIESALLACSGVEQVCVFARPSEEWGQEVCAALVVVQGFALGAAVSHLRRCLPSFNIPRAWAVVPQLPTSPNGKVNRRQVATEVGPLCSPL